MAEKYGLRYCNRFIFNNCKIANELRKYRDLAHCINQVSLSGEKYRKPSDCTDYAEYIISQELSCLDMIVANAAYTVMTAITPGTSFPAEAIARVMAGNLERRITSKKRAELESCLQKLAETQLYILAEHDHQVEQDLYEGAFLPITWEPDGGRLKFQFQPGKTMPLYQYAEHHRQLIQIPFQRLRDDQDTELIRHNNNDRMLLLRHFLLQELEVLRYPDNRVKEQKIRLVKKDREGQEMGLLWILGLLESGQDYTSTAQKVQTIMQQLLDNWQRCGYMDTIQYQVLPPEEGMGIQLTYTEDTKITE